MNLKEYERDVARIAVEITKYLVIRGSSLADAQDTVQDTIVKLLELEIYLPSDKLRAWMYRVSIRTYINKYRRHQHYQALIKQIGREISEFAPPDASDDLREVLQKLPATDEKLLLAFYYEKKSVKALAQLTGVSQSTIKVRLFRARKKLKEILAKEGYDEWKF